MKLTILGSGSYQPELNRKSSSHLIQIANQNIVFDFGRGAIDQLMKLGIEYYDIDEIFITHTHPDHFTDLGPFLHIALAEPEQGKKRKKDITIYGPAGFKQKMKYFYKALNLEKFRPKYKVYIKELKEKEIIKDKKWQLQGFSNKHSCINGLCFRFSSEGKVFAYSGDSTDCPGLRGAARNADLALFEASWPKELKPGAHMTAEQSGKTAQASNVKKLVLTHASPLYFKKYNIVKLAKKFYKGPVIAAKDLMKIKI